MINSLYFDGLDQYDALIYYYPLNKITVELLFYPWYWNQKEPDIVFHFINSKTPPAW